MASKMKLVYFDVRGKAELIRLLLTAANVEFEDERIQVADWPAIKPTTPNGQVPYMVMDGKAYTESLALAQYVAAKYGFAGKNELEALRANIILFMIDDLKQAFIKHVIQKVKSGQHNYGSIAQLFQKAAEEAKPNENSSFPSVHLPAFFAKMEKKLEENDTGFLVGDGMTIADLAVMDLGDLADKEAPSVQENFPKIQAHRQKIRSMPHIADYLEKRKDTPI